MAWRDTASYPKFFQFDARCILPIVIVFFHFRLWTIILAVIVILFFVFLNQRGITVVVFYRFIWLSIGRKERTKIRGRVWRRRLRD